MNKIAKQIKHINIFLIQLIQDWKVPQSNFRDRASWVILGYSKSLVNRDHHEFDNSRLYLNLSFLVLF